jgi:hypothetical protein
VTLAGRRHPVPARERPLPRARYDPECRRKNDDGARNHSNDRPVAIRDVRGHAHAKRGRVAVMDIRPVKPSRGRIDVADHKTTKKIAKHLGVAPERIEEAVEKVGENAAAVRKELGSSR